MTGGTNSSAEEAGPAATRTKLSPFLWSAIPLLLLCSPNLLAFQELPEYRLANLVFAASLLVFPLGIPKVRVRAYLLWFGLPAMLMVPAALAYIHTYRQMPSRWIMFVLLDTNMREVATFTFYLIALAVITPLLLGAHLWMVLRRVPRDLALRPWRLRACVLGVPLIILARDIHTYGAKTLDNLGMHRARTLFPVGTWAEGIMGLANYREFKNRHSVSQKLVLTASHETLTPRRRQIYILGIGESSRYHNWALYGYPRDTNPRLSKLENIAAFHETAAVGTVTGQAVPLIVTSATPETFSKAIRSPSVCHVFRAAGFKTHWISNQSHPGFRRDASTELGADADEISFVRGVTRPSPQSGKPMFYAYDSEVIPIVRHILEKDREQDLLIIIHFYGSHIIYRDQYPEEFRHFPEAITDEVAWGIRFRATPDNRQQMLNSYDNTIRFTDHVLAEIIGLIQAEKAAGALWFCSDHGESLFEDTRAVCTHGMATEYVLHIPMFAWCSPEHRAAYPGKFEQMMTHAKTPLSASCLFHSLIDLAGISSPVVDLTQCVTRDTFQTRPRKFVLPDGSIGDYDVDMLPHRKATDPFDEWPVAKALSR